MSEKKSLYLQNCEIRKELGEDIKFFELQENDIWNKVEFDTLRHEYEGKTLYVNRMRLNLEKIESKEFKLKYELIDDINSVLIVGGGIEKQKPLVDIELFKFRRKKDDKIFHLVNCHRLFQLKVFDNVYKDNYFGAYYTSYFANEDCEEIKKILEVIFFSLSGVIDGSFELFDTSNQCYLYDTSWSSAIIKMARFYTKSNDPLLKNDIKRLCMEICSKEIERRFMREYKNIDIHKLCDFISPWDLIENSSMVRILEQKIEYSIFNPEEKFDLEKLNNIFNFADYDSQILLLDRFNIDIRLESRKVKFKLNHVLSQKINSYIYIPSKMTIEIIAGKKTIISREFELTNEKKFSLLNFLLHAILTDEQVIEEE